MSDVVISREHAIACATNVARQVGYAIGVHGSQLRDLDLIAAPWVENDDAPLQLATPRELANLIANALPGIVGPPNQKPHGRFAFVIYPRHLYGIDTWYIDLSVMPRRRHRSAG